MSNKGYVPNWKLRPETAKVYGLGLMTEHAMPPGFAALKKRLMSRGKLDERMASYLAAVLRMSQDDDMLANRIGRKGLGCDLLSVPVWKSNNLGYVDIAHKYARRIYG